MYVPKNLEMNSIQQAHDFIEQFSFGVIVSSSLEGTHIPFLLNRKEGELGTLYCHFARANPQWKTLEGNQVLTIFHGPHAYVSPTWYAAKPNVPTWNYAAVHTIGQASRLDDEATLDVIKQTVEHYEPHLSVENDIITDEYRDRLLKGIVAFKIDITRLDGKLKLGQQRSIADQNGVTAALSAQQSLDAQGLLNYMKKINVGLGESL